jgi:uncharacterized protein (TIGR02266 family)
MGEPAQSAVSGLHARVVGVRTGAAMDPEDLAVRLASVEARLKETEQERDDLAARLALALADLSALGQAGRAGTSPGHSIAGPANFVDDDSDIELEEEAPAVTRSLVAGPPPLESMRAESLGRIESLTAPPPYPSPSLSPTISMVPSADADLATRPGSARSEAPLSRLLVSTFPPAKRDSVPPSGSERRREDRFTGEFEVEFLGDTHFTTGLTQDLSEGGVFIATYQRLPIGTAVSLAFDLPGGLRVEAQGEVRWVRGEREDGETRPGLGVAFTELGPEALAGIVEYCRGSAARYYEF